jgi:hypothetical protein
MRLYLCLLPSYSFAKDGIYHTLEANGKEGPYRRSKAATKRTHCVTHTQYPRLEMMKRPYPKFRIASSLSFLIPTTQAAKPWKTSGGPEQSKASAKDTIMTPFYYAFRLRVTDMKGQDRT